MEYEGERRGPISNIQRHSNVIMCLYSLVSYNIPNFGPNTYRHVPNDYDDYLDVLFLYWIEDPTAYEHDDLFYILGISQLLMIYIYI